MPYPCISDFGNRHNSQPLKVFDYCMFDTIDKAFANGPGAPNLLGPTAPSCQAFMAQQCAAEWGPYCEMYYKAHGPCGGSNEQTFPNTQRYAPFPAPKGYHLTLGEALLRNAAVRRFVDLTGVPHSLEPVNPTDYSSPLVAVYSAQREPGCGMPACALTEEAEHECIDADPVMLRMLANPEPVADVLKHIYLRLRNTNSRTFETLKQMFGCR